MMGTILNIVSILATFLVAQLILFGIQNFILGRIVLLNQEVYTSIKIKYLLFFTISTFIILKFTNFYLPY